MASGKIWRRPPVLLALCLVSVGGVVTLLGRLATGPAVALKKVTVSTDQGAKAYPAFAPDGVRLAYSARATSTKDDTFHIFIRDVTGGTPQQITNGTSNDIGPAWSPDGKQIAFVRLNEGEGECVVIPDSGGGAERKIPGCTAPGDEAQPFPAVSWMRDGQSLVVVQAVEQQPPSLAILSLSDGKFKTLTHPPAGTEDSTPAVSPDGSSIAFVRSTGTDNANIFVADSAGASPAHAVTFDGRGIRGISWTRDGQDLVYTGQRVGRWSLWRVPAYGGSPRDLLLASRNATYVAVAPVGNRLVYTVSPEVSSIWRARLGDADAAQDHVIIRSSGRENCPRYSPDGKMIADISDQTGNDEIWLSDADGGNRVQLTTFKGPELARIRWSPDSKSLIFDASGEDDNNLYTIQAKAGANPVTVQLAAMNGSWSRDGESIYYQAHGHIWKSAANGSDPKQIAQSQGAQPVESADGKYIYYRRGRSFWRIPTGGGDEEEAIVPEHDLMWSTTMQPTKDGIYYYEWERSSRLPVVSFFNFAEKKSSVVFRVKHGGGRDATYSVSPDGKFILYARVDQSQTNLEALENFH